MSTPPRVRELGAAIETFVASLRGELDDPRARFHSLIAVDLLRQLLDEVEHAGELDAARGRLLARAGAANDAALVADIRARTVDGGMLRAAALEALGLQLEILRPKFDRRRDIR